MNDKALKLRYGDRTHYSLMVELDQQRTARENAETNLMKYQRAFTYLLKQKWFRNKVHTLPDDIKRL